MSHSSLSNPPTGPVFTPISLQVTSEPFLSGETTINLLITPLSTSSASTISFTVQFYTVGAISPYGPSTDAQFDPLPQPSSYSFTNNPAQIRQFGNNARCSIHVLPRIAEPAGQTLVITVLSSEEGSSMAAATIPVVASASSATLRKAA